MNRNVFSDAKYSKGAPQSCFQLDEAKGIIFLSILSLLSVFTSKLFNLYRAFTIIQVIFADILFYFMTDDNITDEDILEMLKPETDLERLLIQQPALKAGLLWGEPRYGHPEGRVLYHIPEIFENIDNIMPPLSIEARQSLRLITLLHDSFKYQEDKSDPRDWSQHHSKLARRFAEGFISDVRILETIELHDDAYYCWRLAALHHDELKSNKRFDALLERVKPFLQLYYLFFKCDTATGDKTQAPMKWFERKVVGIDIVSFRRN